MSTKIHRVVVSSVKFERSESHTL